VLLQYELQFQSWIRQILQQRTGMSINYHSWKQSISYRYNLVFLLQMMTSDAEFQSIVLIADNYCECTKYYYCFYCMMYDITQPMTVSAYLQTELLDLDDLNGLQ